MPLLLPYPCPLASSTKFRVGHDSVRKLWGQKDMGPNPNCVICMIWMAPQQLSHYLLLSLCSMTLTFFLCLKQATIIFHLAFASLSNIALFPQSTHGWPFLVQGLVLCLANVPINFPLKLFSIPLLYFLHSTSHHLTVS